MRAGQKMLKRGTHCIYVLYTVCVVESKRDTYINKGTQFKLIRKHWGIRDRKEAYTIISVGVWLSLNLDLDYCKH